MEILILNNCSGCTKEEWTTVVSPYYLCSDCCIHKCPECKETEVMFMVSQRNEKRKTKILKCLNEDCLYTHEGRTFDFEDHDEDNTKKWSLKVRQCVKRKLVF